MESIPSFNSYIEKSIKENWDKDALTDYKGATLQFKDVARKIEKIHILFESSGVKKGDKIAICGRNSSHWAVTFLATLTYGAVAVPILHDNIVNHSGSKLLFVGDVVATHIDESQMPNLEGIIYLPDFSLVESRTEKLDYAREHLNEMYGHKMIPYRALWGNLDTCMEVLGKKIQKNGNMLSILPMAHMYGMSMEFIFGFCGGSHLYFLTRLPSPAIIAQAFAEIHPSIVISVPLVVEKIVRKGVFPKVQRNIVKLLLNMPVVSKKVKEQIRIEVNKAFGGNAYEVIVGGAALSQEVEQFLKNIDFPITVGYGTTECAPLISYSDYKDFVPGSCGTPVKHMEVKIVKNKPSDQLGEIVTRGTNVMLGYYNNEEATRQVLDKDGWYHTGDLGEMSADGHIFIKGRIKNMLLGSNGQNVYPEEIEDKLNSMMMVNECLIVQRNNKLVALVYPDMDEVSNMGLTNLDVETIMEQNLKELNNTLPAYCKIAEIKIHDEEFAKTPKKSIKRYMYN